MEKLGHKTPGNTVHVNDKGVLILTLRGKQDLTHAQTMLTLVRDYIKKQHRIGKKTLLLIDMHTLKVADATSEARNEARRLLGGVSIDAIAFIGSGIITNITAYLMRVASPHTHVEYFTNTEKAEHWLTTLEKPKAQRSQIALVASIIISLVGLLALIGWQTDNTYLKSFNPDLRPINPTAAASLLTLGVAFFCYWMRAIRPLRILGVFGIVLGITIFLPINIDTLLFHDKVVAGGGHVHIADSAGICFILSGIMGLLAWRPGMRAIITQYVLGSLIVLLAFFNAFGLLYATDFMYSISPDFVMALNLSFSFVVAGVSFIFLTIFRQMGGVLNRVSRTGWLIVAALVFVQFATYSSWNQAVTRNKTETINAFENRKGEINSAVQARIQAYIDALHGFSGFFASSGYVSEKEFETYHNSLDLAHTYPGVRSIAFIARVHNNELKEFIKERQQDDSLIPGGRPNFKINNLSTFDPHYIATYVANQSTSSSIGNDITAIPGRFDIYNSAIDSGTSYASGTVEFTATSAQPNGSRGFFIAMPVKNIDSKNYIGVVNAYFNYDTFFDKLFTSTQATRDNLDITIRDQGTVIYQSKDKQGATAYASTSTATVANRQWDVTIEAPTGFGISQSQAGSPWSTLVGGQFFAALLIFIFILQARSRQRAIQLADIATADLQKERQSIIELNKKDEAILDSIGEGLVGVNEHGIVELINDAACRQLGYKQDDVIGKMFDQVLRATDMQGRAITKENRPIAKALAGHHAISTMVQYARKDNVVFPVRLNVAPIKNAAGKTIGAIEVFQDFTKERELDKAKSEFVSLASHQLRTPLSAINWYSEMLLNGDAGKINKEQQEYLKEIFEGNKRMVELVDSLLNVSRLEVGKLKNEPVDVTITDIADSLEKELAVSIKTHKIDYRREADPKLPTLFADPKLIRIILQNLLSNAVKYTPDSGKVRLTIRRASTEDVHVAGVARGIDYVYIGVSDTGYGIPETQKSKIFEKLFRADNVRKLDVEGTGLGLYIVLEITKLFGGHVWFDTKEGHGTTFHVVIPVKTKPSA